MHYAWRIFGGVGEREHLCASVDSVNETSFVYLSNIKYRIQIEFILNYIYFKYQYSLLPAAATTTTTTSTIRQIQPCSFPNIYINDLNASSICVLCYNEMWYIWFSFSVYQCVCSFYPISPFHIHGHMYVQYKTVIFLMCINIFSPHFCWASLCLRLAYCLLNTSFLILFASGISRVHSEKTKKKNQPERVIGRQIHSQSTFYFWIEISLK